MARTSLKAVDVERLENTSFASALAGGPDLVTVTVKADVALTFLCASIWPSDCCVSDEQTGCCASDEETGCCVSDVRTGCCVSAGGSCGCCEDSCTCCSGGCTLIAICESIPDVPTVVVTVQPTIVIRLDHAEA